MNFRCRTCWATNDYWQSHCPSCGRPGLIPADTPAKKKEPRGKRRELGQVTTHDVPRLRTGISQIDLVFGGGIAVPSVVQFAGQPGIGKSTCLLQIVDALVDRALYATSEERLEALAARAHRLQLRNAGKITAVATESLDETLKEIHESDARLVVIDSLQGLRMTDPRRRNAQVKHTQLVVRDIATRLIDEAQSKKRTVILVSHVTKTGDLAGLKEIEHLVDTLLWFRGDRSGTRRYLMSEKNRFGRTDVQAHFVMTEHGLVATPPPERRRGAGRGDDDGAGPDDVERDPPPPARPRPPIALVPREQDAPVDAPTLRAPEPMPERSPIRRAPTGDPEVDDDEPPF